MSLTRRTLLLTATAAAAAAPHLAAAQTDQPAMRARAEALLLLLSPAQQASLQTDFTSPARQSWNYMLGSARAPGLALEQMTRDQKEAALALLATALSRSGMTKASNMMLQQDILRDEWNKGSSDRNRERFSVRFFGKPSATDPWAWRWEGHHLSLNFTLIGDQLISTTPNSFSSEPNTVPSGPHKGLVVLTEEETLARALYTDLSSTARAVALVNENSPGNVLTTRGQQNRYDGDTRGLPLADMTSGQRDMARHLIEVYTAQPFAAPLVQDGDVMATRFIWAGANLDGSIYYRLHGPAALIEFATLRNQPLHLHTAVHDLSRNFGGDRV